MKKLKSFLKILMSFLNPILELAIYVLLAFAISKILKIHFIPAIIIVYTFFILDMIRSKLKKNS